MELEKAAFVWVAVFAAFALWAPANLYPGSIQLVSAAVAFLFLLSAVLLFSSVLLPPMKEEEIITEIIFDYRDKEELPTLEEEIF